MFVKKFLDLGTLANVTLEWFSDFYQVAKIALEGEPQLREKLGMLERN